MSLLALYGIIAHPKTDGGFLPSRARGCRDVGLYQCYKKPTSFETVLYTKTLDFEHKKLQKILGPNFVRFLTEK